MSMSRGLGDDIEVCAGEPVSPDTLEEPPERRGIGHIGGLCLTRTACRRYGHGRRRLLSPNRQVLKELPTFCRN